MRESKKGSLVRQILLFFALIACTTGTTTTQKGCTAKNACDQDADGFKAVGWVTILDATGKTTKSYCATVPIAQRDCSDLDANNWKSCATCKDADGDGYFTGCDAYKSIKGPDCNDADAAINPGAAEVCDGIDNNCDGNLMEGENVDLNQNGIMACMADENDTLLEATVRIEPESFNENTGKFTAFVVLQEGFDTNLITKCVADGAVAISINFEDGVAICKFNRDDITVLPVDTLFEVSGETSDGFTFIGTDEIKKVVE